MRHTDGEAVIMLAFQASGRGSTPLRCSFFDDIESELVELPYSGNNFQIEPEKAESNQRYVQ